MKYELTNDAKKILQDLCNTVNSAKYSSNDIDLTEKDILSKAIEVFNTIVLERFDKRTTIVRHKNGDYCYEIDLLDININFPNLD